MQEKFDSKRGPTVTEFVVIFNNLNYMCLNDSNAHSLGANQSGYLQLVLFKEVKRLHVFISYSLSCLA